MVDIETTQSGGRAVVRPTTDLVAPAIAALRPRLRELVAAGATELELDLAAVTMLDSSGIGLLVATHNSLQRHGGRLVVANASGEICELLRTMRLHQHFQVTAA